MKQLRYSCSALLALLGIPVAALAHGTEEEHQQEVIMNTFIENGFIVASILFVVLIITWYFMNKKIGSLNVKKKQESMKRNQLTKRAKAVLLTSLLPLLTAIILGFINNNQSTESAVIFPDIHGLGYSSDDQDIFVPAHDGLKVYADGNWSAQTEGERHDYMGFSMVKDGFYSSGHPPFGSEMENPLGIVKSTDKGKSLEILDLYKEVDFHGMAAGYETNDIYVFNPKPNSRMDESGFYYSTDETKTWSQSKLEGLVGQASTVAVHPTKEGIVAIGTDNGVFLSSDYGDSFEPLLKQVTPTAISFDHHNSLLVGVPGKLLSLSLDGTNETDLNLPQLASEDTVVYVKQNPADAKEYVFTTFEKNIFISKDSGNTWAQIADQGTAKHVDQ